MAEIPSMPEDSHEFPRNDHPSATESHLLRSCTSEKVSTTVGIAAEGFENPANAAKYQQLSLRLFPTIANRIQREIHSGRKFQHTAIPASELPDNAYLSDFEKHREFEKRRMLSLLESIAKAINPDPSVPRKYPVVIAADDCFTNGLVISLLRDFLGQSAFAEYFTHAKLTYDRAHDDVEFSGKIHQNALVLGWGSYEDTYSIDPLYYGSVLCEYMRRSATGTSDRFNVRFLNTCFSHQLFGNNLGILNRESPYVSATVKGPAQFSITACRIPPIERESELVKKALKYVCPNPKEGARLSVASTRTGYQYYDLLWDGDKRLARDMGIVPLAFDEVSETIVIATTPNHRVFTIQPHPEIDIVNPTNVMEEIGSVAHYLTPVYGTGKEIAENYRLRNESGNPRIAYNSGLPFYVWTINALLEDTLEHLEKGSPPSPQGLSFAERKNELERSLGKSSDLEATGENLTDFLAFFRAYAWMLGEDAYAFREGDFGVMLSAGILVSAEWFGAIGSIRDPWLRGAMEKGYASLRNYRRYQELDREGRLRAEGLSSGFDGGAEAVSDSAGLKNLEGMVRSHGDFLREHGLLEGAYAFYETNATGKLLSDLGEKFKAEPESVFLSWSADSFPVSVYEILLNTGGQEAFAKAFRWFLETLDHETLNRFGMKKEYVDIFADRAITREAINDFVYAPIARKLTKAISEKGMSWSFSEALEAAFDAIDFDTDTVWYVNSQNTRNRFVYEDFLKYPLPIFHVLFFRSEAFRGWLSEFKIRVWDEAPFHALRTDITRIRNRDDRAAAPPSHFVCINRVPEFQSSAAYYESLSSLVSKETLPGSVILETNATQNRTYVPRVFELMNLKREFGDAIEIFAVTDPQSNLIRSALVCRKPFDVSFLEDSVREGCELMPIQTLFENPYYKFQSVTRKYLASNFKHPSIFRSFNTNADVDAAVSGLVQSFVSGLSEGARPVGGVSVRTQWAKRLIRFSQGTESVQSLVDVARFDNFCQVAVRDFCNDVFGIVNKLVVKLNSLEVMRDLLEMLNFKAGLDMQEVEFRLGELVDHYFDAKRSLSGLDLQDVELLERPDLFYDKIWADSTKPQRITGFNIDHRFLLMIVEKLFNGLLSSEKVLEIAHRLRDVDIERYFVYNTVPEESIRIFSREIGEDIDAAFGENISIGNDFDISARPIEERLREQMSKGVPDGMTSALLASLHQDGSRVMNDEYIERLKYEQQKTKENAMGLLAQKLRDSAPGSVVEVTNGSRVIRMTL